MFHAVPQPILDRMRYLEEVDTQDRQDGTPRLQRLRQIPPETGKFLALLAASVPEGAYIEIGTSAGYSSFHLGYNRHWFTTGDWLGCPHHENQASGLT